MNLFHTCTFNIIRWENLRIKKLMLFLVSLHFYGHQNNIDYVTLFYRGCGGKMLTSSVWALETASEFSHCK